MAHLIDRRLNSKGKSTVNRQRFLRRYRTQIKKAVSDAVSRRSVTDIDKGEKISIPTRDISEPVFRQGSGGEQHRVLPGNDRFIPGDSIPKPPGGAGGGSGDGDASNQGEGQDEFQFTISKDEYLDMLFDDLELPNLKKTELDKLVEFKTFRAGISAEGMPSNINVVRSLRQSLARRIAMSAGKKRQLRELQEQLAQLRASPTPCPLEIARVEAEIAELERRIAAVPYIDTFDLRYNNFVQRPVPTAKAVMFCLMDVSGSMDQATKEMAKRFYILLYLFLTRTYQQIDLVFIRHHTQAKEVDEHEFFYSQETGGTIVSSALKLMDEIITARYPTNQWNIYAAQASDGDNWADDSPTCRKLLEEKLLPVVRYFTYIEITHRPHQTLWHEYEKLTQNHPQFAIQRIQRVEDIYPVFREFFQRSSKQVA